MSERDVDKILLFREDISPFLVHLTKATEVDAKTNLENILRTKELRYENNAISDARFGYPLNSLTNQIAKDYFSAVCFTETPLSEIHNLLEIAGRRVNLQSYGLVFLKDKLKENGVSPVFYLNNEQANKNNLVHVMCNLISTNPSEAKQILPYISIFGKYLTPNGGASTGGEIDFMWEREWRYASDSYKFTFDFDDVFIGLCPDDQISFFEQSFPDLTFVDPTKNMKWYAEKLIDARHRSNLDNSVV